MMDMSKRTFFYGDLFTQGGGGEVALTESEILGPLRALLADMAVHVPRELDDGARDALIGSMRQRMHATFRTAAAALRG